MNSELHGMSSLPVLKGFWLNRPRIRLSRSCVCVGGLGFGMVVRFVCVIRVPVFPVCPVCVPATATGAVFEPPEGKRPRGGPHPFT